MKGCLTVCVLVILSVLSLHWVMFGDRSSFATGLPNLNGLPKEASDITVYQNKNISGVFLADFRIPEKDLVTFGIAHNWDLRPVSGSVSVFHANAFHERRPNERKEISDGLYYSKRVNNGGGVTVAYDRKEGRAYIDRSSR